MKSKIIAVDFDGTLCENKWPEIGSANMDLLRYLKREKSNGSKIILWTCREGTELKEAVKWCLMHNLVPDAVNRNLPEVVKDFGIDCRKIFANEYIDDKSCCLFNLPYTEAKHL